MKCIFLISLIYIISMSTFAGNSKKNKECNLDLSSRSKNINWNSYGPTILAEGRSIEKLKAGKFAVHFKTDQKINDQNWIYQCVYIAYLGADHCVYDKDRDYDAFVIIRNKGSYQVFDYYYDSELGSIVLKDEVKGTFICR